MNKESGKGGFLKIILLMIGVMAFVFFVLPKTGAIKTSEETKITDNPKSKVSWKEFKKKKEKELKESRAKEKSADKLLSQFIASKSERQQMKNADKNFLKSAASKYENKKGITSENSFFDFMNTSYQIYQATKSINDGVQQSSDLINKMLELDDTEMNQFSDKNPSGKEWINYLENK